jgi:hypothetical protein
MNRREFLGSSTAVAAGFASFGWRERVAAQMPNKPIVIQVSSEAPPETVEGSASLGDNSCRRSISRSVFTDPIRRTRFCNVENRDFLPDLP